MNQQLKDKLSLLPSSPGCYLMKNSEGRIIYVGKAKKLKNRVNSYFVGAHDYKTTKLVSEIVDFEYIVTHSEKEALLLEINLIKDNSPQYNIMFMDNCYYPYIQMTNEDHPRLKIVRDASQKKAKHFGPFPDATAAREMIKLLNRLYPLRQCNHIPKKPCLYYSLQQCLGPCINEVDTQVYQSMKKEISAFLNGDTKEKIDELTSKMIQASEDLRFEQAKEYRDLIEHIKYVTSKQHVQFDDRVDRDILGYYVDKGYLSIQLFFMRNGKLLSRDLNLIPVGDSVDDDLHQFIVTFYQTNTLPKELLVPYELETDVIEDILDCKIIKPQKGNKLKLVQMANDNAKEQLEKKFQMVEKNHAATIGAVEQLGTLLSIPTPHVIELFDNSHIQGAYSVSGMVCFKDGIPSKKDYRKFKIQTVQGVDDYASMKEVVYRRYFRLIMEQRPMPNLIIVDGGKGQIDVAREVIESLNLSIPVAGLSKNDKHQTAQLIDQEGQPVDVHPKSELFFLLTRMQDEVHRYAISFHKNVRSQSLYRSLLDNVPGIGEKRQKALMTHFKSVKRMREATLEELSEFLPIETAKNLYNVLHDTHNST